MPAADAPSDAARSVPEPSRIGRYVTLGRIGEGGMGVVYVAYDTDLDRKVAVKLVRAAQLGPDQARTRVLREAQAMAQVSHPNVVHVYEVGEHRPPANSDGNSDDSGAQIYIAMEFIAGSNLHTYQSQEGRTTAQVLEMYLQAGEGLLAAHRCNLIHRDFKPDNVLVDEAGRAHVADFGLARLVGESLDPPPPAVEQNDSQRPLSQRLTEAGALVGTPRYMSPEQYESNEIDARSDQFSFCAALYEALYKQAPFAGETVLEMGWNVVEGQLRPLPPNDIPKEVTQAILRGLSVEPGQRFASMQELLDELRKGVDPHVDTAGSRSARRIFSWAIAVVGVLGSVPGILQGSPPPLSNMLMAGASCLVIALCITLLAYRRLRQHPMHWRLVLLLDLCLAQLVISRSLAVSAKVTINQYTSIDHVITMGICSIIAYSYIPKLWIGVAMTGVSCALNAIAPQHAWWIPPLIYPALAFMLAAWWPSRIKQAVA